MKKTGQQTRFRDDLRRLLLFYALLPVLAAVLLLIVSLGYIPLQNVVRGTADDLQLAWDAFGQQWRDHGRRAHRSAKRAGPFGLSFQRQLPGGVQKPHLPVHQPKRDSSPILSAGRRTNP